MPWRAFAGRRVAESVWRVASPNLDSTPPSAPCSRPFFTPCPSSQKQKVCGNPNLDFAALERNAKYEGGFSAATPAVGWLWGIVKEELTFDEKKMFLKFFTGSDRWEVRRVGSLLGGHAAVAMRVCVGGGGTDGGALECATLPCRTKHT